MPDRAEALLDLKGASEQADLQVFSKRLMGLEPTTFCMAIVSEDRSFAQKVAFELNPIAVD